MLVILALLSCVFALVPLSVDIVGGGRRCFYVRAHTEEAKIRLDFAVMTGGDYLLDAVLTRPDGSVAQSVHRSEGDSWLLVAGAIGDYELCFTNEQNEEKSVRFEYSIDTNAIEAVAPKPVSDEHTLEMDRYINEIDVMASELSRKLQYLRQRNIRNEATVTSTASRVRWFSLIGMLSMISVAGLNVMLVKYFFKGSRSNVV